MGNLASILSASIDWKTAETDPDLKDFLGDLQANIVKGHGRHHTGHIFISLGGMTRDAVAAVVRALGNQCTSAYTQLRTNRKNPPHLDAGPVRCLFLAASGYRALGLDPPPGGAFAAGMGGRTAELNDPLRNRWDEVGWSGLAPDAMFLVADTDVDGVTKALEAAESWLGGTGARVLFVERGFQQFRAFRPGHPEGVEHFGYVDGRSQPLVLTDEIADEPQAHWIPEFKPSQFIVHDPNGAGPRSAGSYFVFRKLEQNVRGFNAAETALGKAYFGDEASKDELDRAGAMVVGRFEDGTPLALMCQESGGAVANDFNYDADTEGEQCPFHAHIRKTNPRGDVRREFDLPNDDGDRDPIMIRRGITYGAPRPMTADGKDFSDEGAEPVRHSGLLFMAYMASIEKQFEFTQNSWANNPDFLRPQTGVDPVIGQARNPSELQHTYSDGCSGGAAKALSFASFVTMMGGEYFFAPSLSFVRGVGLA